MEIAGIPTRDIAIPDAIRELRPNDVIEAVWENPLGGVTFRIGAPKPWAFVKWAPAGSGLDLSAEIVRLRWAEPFTRVPHVLGEGSNDAGSWLLTRAVPGQSAVSARWLQDPVTAVRAVGAGLRALHDALPVGECPFSWSVADRAGRLTRDARAALPHVPPIDRLVVCHGDACAPNTLIGDGGEWAAHVDLGLLGVADCWADLAVATWSTEWNYGPGFEGALLDAYGVAPDKARMSFYRTLWDLE